MKICKPDLFEQDGKVFYNVSVSSLAGDKTLYFSLDKQFSNFISGVSDAPLLGLLIPAMSMGEDIYVNGKISERLYFNLSGPYQKILQIVMPNLHQINIYPEYLYSDIHRGSGVISGFSGGIDSFCMLADHYYNDVPESYKITHLLYNNNLPTHVTDGEILFTKRSNLTASLVEKIGLPLIVINSNLNDFYEGFAFRKTHTPRNTSIALLLQNGAKRFLYASAYHYTDISIKPMQTMANSDAITLPLLSTESLDAVSVGSEYTRVEKTFRVANLKESYDSLNVCMKNDRNCSRCEKCMRTLLTLEIAGLLDLYSNSFDLNKYRNYRDEYIVKILQSSWSLHREIIEDASSQNFRFPRYLRLKARTLNSVKGIARKILSRAKIF